VAIDIGQSSSLVNGLFCMRGADGAVQRLEGMPKVKGRSDQVDRSGQAGEKRFPLRDLKSVFQMRVQHVKFVLGLASAQSEESWRLEEIPRRCASSG
jgi:hypothetical protein